jgi:hypothetical protein
MHSARPHFGPLPSVRPGPATQATRPAHPAWHARCAHPRGHCAWCGRDSLAGLGSPTEKVRRERRRKHRGSQGSAPDKEVAVGAHLSGTEMVKCGGGGSTVAFEAVEAFQWSAAVG